MPIQRKIKVEVLKKTAYPNNIYLFRLSPEKQLPFFNPGQFLHLAIDKYDPSYHWPESRAFSIATSSSTLDFLEVLISIKGEFTNRLKNEIDIGDEVWIKLPYGDFNFSKSSDRDTVLIAGGTGISPFMSFLRYAIDHKLNPSINLFYGVKNESMLIIESLLEECNKKIKNFNYQLFIEHPDNPNDDLRFTKGVLSFRSIMKKTKSLNNPIYYLSGPPAMIEAFEEGLIKAGISESSIMFDRWE